MLQGCKHLYLGNIVIDRDFSVEIYVIDRIFTKMITSHTWEFQTGEYEFMGSKEGSCETFTYQPAHGRASQPSLRKVIGNGSYSEGKAGRSIGQKIGNWTSLGPLRASWTPR